MKGCIYQGLGFGEVGVGVTAVSRTEGSEARVGCAVRILRRSLAQFGEDGVGVAAVSRTEGSEARVGCAGHVLRSCLTQRAGCRRAAPCLWDPWLEIPLMRRSGPRV